MNKEVIKAMNKKERKPNIFTKIRKWWSKNGYKVLRVILFPLWFAIVAKDKINKLLNDRTPWNEERAKEIFDYYIPKASHWHDDEKEFYFFDNGYGWEFCYAKKILKCKDYRFWKRHCSWWGGKMRTYLIDKYELEGFTKKVINTDSGWTEIVFKMTSPL